MNFVFISPNFPEAYRWFCIRLRDNGVNVLGVGDAPYDALHPDLKANLDTVCEYYGTPIVGHHRAVVDCAWSAACYRKMREEILALQDSGQISLVEGTVQKKPAREISLREMRETCRILRISGWKSGKRRRIYVTTNIADIYYDIPGKVWNVARRKIDANLNLDVFSRFLLEQLNLSIPEFEARYQPVA